MNPKKSDKNHAQIKYAKKHRAELNAKHKEYRGKRGELFRSLKSKPCADCGVSYGPHVMDFDHVRGEKEYNIGNMQHYSLQRLLDEIAKCDLVCANCHRERTYQRRCST